jgi:GNAT superfamily N-acetyltransferase
VETDRRLLAQSLPIQEVSPADPVAEAAVTAYVEELSRRFVTVFRPGPTTEAEVAAEVASMTRPRGVFLLISLRDEPVACGGLRRLDGRTLEIKRMWVRRDWRGTGLGGRVLTALERAAGELGADRVVLDTSRVLTEAMGLYARAGYREIERYNDNPYAEAWFEKPVRG